MSIAAKRGLVAVAAVALVILGARQLFFADWAPAQVIETLRAYRVHGLALPAYALFFAAGTALFLPAAAMIAIAGVTWGFWPGAAIAWAVGNLCIHLQFALSRLFAGRVLRDWAERPRLRWLFRELETGGVVSTIVARQFPVPFVVVNVAAGLTPVKWPQWVVGNAIGLVPHALIYTQLAAALLDGAAGAKTTAALRMLSAGAGIVLLGLGSRWLHRRAVKP